MMCCFPKKEGFEDCRSVASKMEMLMFHVASGGVVPLNGDQALPLVSTSYWEGNTPKVLLRESTQSITCTNKFLVVFFGQYEG